MAPEHLGRGDGGVLVHDRDVDVVAKARPQHLQDTERIVEMARQYEMAHDDAALHDAVVVHPPAARTPHLLDHDPNRLECDLGIIPCAAQLPGKVRRCILEVGQPHVHVILERVQHTGTLIRGCVVHHGKVQAVPTGNLKRAMDMRRVVRRCHEVDVVRTLGLQPQHCLGKLLDGDLFAPSRRRNVAVLAEDALERAVREEHGA